MFIDMTDKEKKSLEGVSGLNMFSEMFFNTIRGGGLAYHDYIFIALSIYSHLRK